ncbi:hypothetical protein D0C36_09135 [Mucilaginibacter conchicola]|uniref:Uncharacterized protein n=2 Tax=Mucilaginibacter conchicola TaxID=2303333 RepID=A0A372P057_9SPHI|nr:hypothetical protein D0C36_09135 [Mucilaginibacter conchicola]
MFAYSLKASEEFINCADKQLTDIFIERTGVTPGKNVCISLAKHYTGAPIYTDYLIKGSNFLGRKLMINLYVNHSWLPITILWKSKTKKDYKLHDTNIDCDDIEFWFEELDVALIHKQLYPNVKLPFKLKDLSYELVVTRINMDATIEIKLKPEHQSVADKIINEVDSFIAKFNEDSEKKDRKYGVIYNWTPKIELGNIVFDINLGSTGPYFFKKLFPFLSELNYFERIELC